MDFRPNCRCYPFRFKECFFLTSVVFLLWYCVGILLNHKPIDDPLRQTAKRTSEIKDVRNKKTNRQQKEHVSSLNKTWLPWKKIGSQGVYRACVKRPEPEAMREVITGELILQDIASKLTIEACVEACIQLVFTYASLSRGRECYCTDLSSKSQFLSYEDSALCDVKCTGDMYHNCGGDNYMSVYRTSVPDARCSAIKLGTPGSLPLIALASYPRSGNTWTRHLIQKATGTYTGSVYWEGERELEVAKKEFLGGIVDYKNKDTICVKTHKFDRDKFAGAIMLIRNPYRSIVSEVFRRQMFVSGATREQVVKYFTSKEWKRYVDEEIKNWKLMNLHWIQSRKPFLPIFYEDLEAETVRKLTEMVEFLNRPVELERIVCATQDRPSSLATSPSLGKDGRKMRVYLTEDPFTSEMHQKIDQSIQLVNRTLFKFHRKVLPTEYLKKTDIF
ncbi:sialate:O-sulfotransferase 2-like [Lytechinus pictus]|uniref:sialate:O-sulfotransferase 2-like n=1 Tax=Lytechinus pictus TaxID=7653 RepID=UPI0030B9B808